MAASLICISDAALGQSTMFSNAGCPLSFKFEAGDPKGPEVAALSLSASTLVVAKAAPSHTLTPSVATS